MKKRLKIYILIIIILIGLVNFSKVQAVSTDSSNNDYYSYSSYDYVINSYDINMVVNENNTFDITETITAYFNVPKHGIFRKIPLKNSITRLDGTKSNNIAKISNISVNEEYTTSNENGYKVIKIGNSNKTLTGSHTYKIKYTYNIGKDPLKNADELYYNLIGDQWDTTIKNVSFTIKMPKTFDKSTLGFSSGNVGSTDSSNVIYNVNGNIITGNTLNDLTQGQALTVRLTLPDNYFVGESSNIDGYSVAVIVICLICVLIADRLWAKYGKDDEVIETVEFYPPEGFNSAEVGFLYKGSTDTESVISLLVYLANKGYLKIEETQSKGMFKEFKGFKITKIKEYDGNNEYEKLFFNGLFKEAKNSIDMDKAREIMKEAKNNGEKISLQEAIEMSIDNSNMKTSVTESDLYDNFYITLNKIKQKINTKENRNKIFESSASGKGKWLIIMIIAIFILITTKPVLEYGESEILLFALLFPVIGFSMIIASILGKVPKLFGLIWGGMFGGMPWALMVLPTLTQNTMYLIMYIIGIISIAAITVFAKIMPKRTPYGNEILGKLRGFKRFLETAEKPQLEALVNENPEYFYNILPYTYALGVSKVWMDQFETIAIQAPDWYSGYSAFSVHEFNSFMNSTMRSAQSAMSSSPSSDSGGGSSGGGSSGGGSGGGGGGSW